MKPSEVATLKRGVSGASGMRVSCGRGDLLGRFESLSFDKIIGLVVVAAEAPGSSDDRSL